MPDPGHLYPTLQRAKGVYLWDTDGKRYLDAIAGIAVANLGYGRREVIEAMKKQASVLPYAAPNIFANTPAIELADKVAERTPGDLNWITFTSGGSEAVEVAMKLARQYHEKRGRGTKHLVVGRWTSYHGATFGGLSVGGSALRRRPYEPLLIAMPHLPPSYCYRCPWGLKYPSCRLLCATDLERVILEHGPDQVAAFIAEPVVASAGGAIAPPPGYFKEIRTICSRYNILLIVDEVLTGFGRTGTNFAIEQWDVIPDMIVMGKGMSGGYAPLGAVAASEEIHQAFVETGTAFEHVFTFAGNPISTSAGLAVLTSLEKEGVLENVRTLAPYFRDRLEALRSHSFVGDVRAFGLMAGIEFVRDRATKEPFPLDDHIASRVRDAGLNRGIVTYPGTGMAEGSAGDIISLYPPLTFTRENVDEMFLLLDQTFDDIGAGL